MRFTHVFSAACFITNVAFGISSGLPDLPDKDGDPNAMSGSPPEATYQDSPLKSAGPKFTLTQEGDPDVESEIAEALKVLQLGKGKKSLPTDVTDLTESLEPLDVEYKQGSDRKDRRILAIKNILMNKSLRGKHTIKDFASDVIAPVNLQKKLENSSGGPNRRLQTADCFTLSDGSVACVQLDFPGTGLYTIFANCPTSVTSVLDCGACLVLGAAGGDPDPENDPECLSCSVCTSTVAFDCSNIATGECVERTCSGVCTASPGTSPVPSPTPAPVPSPTTGTSPTSGSSDGGVSCQQDANGDTFCVLPDYPATDFLTVFLNCPAVTTNALQCSTCTVVAPDDTPTDIDLVNDLQCSSCTVCAERAAYDCTNLDSGDCSIYSCEGVCSGPQNTSPTASASQPTFPAPSPAVGQPQPTFPSPTTGGGGTPPPNPFGDIGATKPAPASSVAKNTGVFSFVVLALTSIVGFGFW